MNQTLIVGNAISPLLRSIGFRRFGRVFNREREPGLVHVVHLQGNKWGDGTFTINVGVAVREVIAFENELGRAVVVHMGLSPDVEVKREKAYVSEPEAQLRARLSNFAHPARTDQWWRFEEFDESIAAVNSLLVGPVAAVLEKHSTRREVVARWMSRTMPDGELLPWFRGGRKTSLVSLAALLAQIGERTQAVDVLRAAVDASRGERWEWSTKWAVQRLGLTLA